MKQSIQRSALLIGLAIFALVWTALMGLGVERVSPSADSASHADAELFGAGAHIMYVDESNFPEITVYMAVNDASGQAVFGLGKDDFLLREDGEEVEITGFVGAGGGATSVLLVIDQSGSMADENKLAGAVDAARSYIDFLQPGADQVGVIAFSDGMTWLSPLQIVTEENRGQLRDLLGVLVPTGGTRFYAATREAIRALEDVPGRKVVLALTDGLDGGGQIELQATIAEAQAAHVPVYTVGLGNELDRNGLERLAEQTGGDANFSPNAAQLQALYQSIASGLRNEYALTYRSLTPNLDGTRRNLDAEIGGFAGGLETGGSYSVGGILSSGLNLAIFLPTLLILTFLLVGLLWAPRLRRRPVRATDVAVMEIHENEKPAPPQVLTPAISVQASDTRSAVLVMELPLDRSGLTIGSAPACTYRLTDPSIAPAHARMTQEGARWVIEDLAGSGRTQVSFNGDAQQLRPVQRNAVRHGSMIRLGDVTLVVSSVEGASPRLERRIPIAGANGIAMGTTPACAVHIAATEALEAWVRHDGQRWIVTPTVGVCQVSYSGNPGQFRQISDLNALRAGSRIMLGGAILRFEEAS